MSNDSKTVDAVRMVLDSDPAIDLHRFPIDLDIEDGVLAWWAAGSRDVVNGIAVVPPETDSDDPVADAVSLVLERDPFVNAGQVRVGGVVDRITVRA